MTDFEMNFNFKLVYTDIVYNIKTSCFTVIRDLFTEASIKFELYINYSKYHIDFVIAGQDGSELAPEVDNSYLFETLWDKFGDKWGEISFYVRPVNRDTNIFVRRDNYIDE